MLLSSFSKINLSNYTLQNTIIVSNSLDPDLDPNCLQRLSADEKVNASKERAKRGICNYQNHTCWPIFLWAELAK